MTRPDTLITWYLEMTHRSEFVPAFMRLTDGQISVWSPPTMQAYRDLYQAVGDAYVWRDRLALDDEALAAVLARSEIHLMTLNDQSAGYVELVAQGSTVSIEYFGLVPAFHGRGLGKHLLSHGIASAWDMGAERIIVHTCNLDAPQALDNYVKRGFRIVREEHEPMPEQYRT